MAYPIKSITEFITNYKSINTSIDVEDFREKIFKEYSIMTKYYEDDKLLLMYHKFELPTCNELDEDCRSLVIDTNDLNIVSYTCPNPILNKDALKFLLNNPSLELEIYKCYEGTIMSLFNHNNKWYLTTRRCLDSEMSVWNNTNYNKMFNEVLEKENITFEEFTNKLNPELGYYFILIHHMNKIIIDYSEQFGENYTKLCLVFVRNKKDQVEIYDYHFDNYQNIFKPEKMTMEEFSLLNQELKTKINIEGIIIKTVKDDKNYLLKLQTNSYQFCRSIGSNENIFKGYIYLYQNDILNDYIKNQENCLEKIVNPYDESESFKIIGVIDCVFKTFTLELFELYKLLWKMNSNEHQNTKLYNILPKEYKYVLFKLRGLYYKSKTKIDKKFGMRDIYDYLKSMNLENFCALLRQRKLMLNYVNINKNDETALIYRSISRRSDQVHIKLMSILTNKLFPNINYNDLPKIYKNVQSNEMSENLQELMLETNTEIH